MDTVPVEDGAMKGTDITPNEKPKVDYPELGASVGPAPLTFGQKAVGITFNPGKNPEVEDIKSTFARLIDKAQNTPAQSYLANTIRGAAIRSMMEAQMWSVKLATFKED